MKRFWKNIESEVLICVCLECTILVQIRVFTSSLRYVSDIFCAVFFRWKKNSGNICSIYEHVYFTLHILILYNTDYINIHVPNLLCSMSSSFCFYLFWHLSVRLMFLNVYQSLLLYFALHIFKLKSYLFVLLLFH